jgi:hypothetical protein
VTPRPAFLASVGSFCLGAAWLTGTAVHRVAAVDLAPDGRRSTLPALASAARYEYQVRVKGELRGRFNGAVYDARTCFVQGQPPRVHALLQLEPQQLEHVPGASRAGDHTFAFPTGTDTRYVEVRAHLRTEPVVSEMRLPPEMDDQALEGRLRVELWHRDRLTQGWTAACLCVLALVPLASLPCYPVNRPRRSGALPQ